MAPRTLCLHRKTSSHGWPHSFPDHSTTSPDITACLHPARHSDPGSPRPGEADQLANDVAGSNERDRPDRPLPQPGLSHSRHFKTSHRATPYSRHRSGTPSESAGTQSVRCKNGQPHRLTLRRPLSPALTIHRRCPGKHSRRMIALFADKLIISTENNSLACRCQPGPQPNCYPRAIQTSETTPCVFLRSAGKARYASYPRTQHKNASIVR